MYDVSLGTTLAEWFQTHLLGTPEQEGLASQDMSVPENARRATVAFAVCYASTKTALWALGDCIPGQPYHGYCWVDRLRWLFLEVNDWLLVSSGGAFFLAVSWLWVRHLSPARLLVWSTLLGLVLALLEVVEWTQSAPLAFLAIPPLVAWLLYRRIPEKPSCATRP